LGTRHWERVALKGQFNSAQWQLPG